MVISLSEIQLHSHIGANTDLCFEGPKMGYIFWQCFVAAICKTGIIITRNVMGIIWLAITKLFEERIKVTISITDVVTKL